ncbi:hypothetical protein P8452_52099 [Trifolium repens]|nr:hypothetical protein P8452_52099 [Trifolium repens]
MTGATRRASDNSPGRASQTMNTPGRAPQRCGYVYFFVALPTPRLFEERSSAEQTSQQNTAPSSPNPNQEIDFGAIITNAVPISMVSPTSIKKKRSTRSKKKITNVVEEETVTPPPSAEKSKKKKKSKKSKTETPKIAHTMESLYIDPIGDQPAESEKVGNEDQGNPTQTLEMFNKIALKKITEDKRHPMTQKIINDVLRKINSNDDVPDVDTSLAQEEQGTEENPEDDHDDVEKQISNDYTNPKDDQAVVENQVSNQESPKDDTQADKSEESKNSEEEEGSKASDQNAGEEKDIVDADSIARRTRSGKVSAAAITPSKKDKEKKSVAKPVNESEAEEEDDPDVELNVVHIGASERKSVKKKKIPQGVPEVPIDNISFHSLENVSRWKFVVNRRMALERELSKEALQYKQVMKLIKHAGLMKTVHGLGSCYEKLVKEFLVNIPEDCDNPLSKEYQKVFVRGKEISFSPDTINTYLGRSEEPYPELEVTDDAICKSITGGKVNHWPKKGKLPTSKLTPMFALLNRVAAVNWVPTTHNYEVATGLARFIYCVGNKINFDFGTYIFQQTVKHAKTLAVKMPIAFPSLLCGIIVNQRPDVLVKEDMACRRQSAISFSAQDLNVDSNVSTSATGALSRKEMISTLKETCKTLEEKKTRLEAVIAGLELEEEQDQPDVNAEDDEEAEDHAAEDTDGNTDF